MPISYKNKIYTTLGTPTVASGNGAFVTNSVGVPAKDYTVKGKSIVWNQLMDKSKFEANKTSGGVTFTNNGDGSVTVNGTATADAEYYLIKPSDKFGTVGHKYFLCGCPFRGSYNTYRISSSIELNGTWKDGFSDDGTAGGNISRALSSGEIIHIEITIKSGCAANNLVFKPQLFDLTEMFGVGNEPSTPAEFSAMFPDDYYPYNAGELKSVATTSVEASGVERFQMLQNPNFSNTVVDTRENVGFSVQQLASPYEVFFYRNLQEPGLVSGVFTIPVSGKCRIKHNGSVVDIDFYYFTSVKNHKYYIYINFTSTNPTVAGGVTYDKAQFFDLTEMFGAGNEPATPAEFWQRVPDKLYGYNPNDYRAANIPSLKYFPDGMRSAGSAYDEINFLLQKAIKRIGVRAYQTGDENNTDVMTDKKNTVYELATPVETAITPPLQALSTFKGFTSFSAPNSLMQNGPLAATYYAEGGANPESGWLTSYKRKLYMGRNIEWNQLLDKSGFYTTRTINGVTFTNNGDGTVTANGTATANADFRVSATTYKILANHKCLIVGGVNENAMVLFSGDPTGVWLDKGSGVITNQTVDTTAYNFSIRVNSGTTVSNVIFKPQLFDLTQMFGAGKEPATPEEFWSYFDHKLYPYNPGETQPLFKISRKSQWGSTANKGDLINIEGKQYRVLKTNGNVAEVLAMYNPSSTTQSFGTTQIYANSSADTYCNEIFYSGLSSALQNAIVEKTFAQDSWFRGDSGHSSAIEVYQGVSTDINYVMSLMNRSFGTSITRKCYVISIQDIIDYIGATTAMTTGTTTLKQENIWKLFWNQSTKPGTGAFYYPWLRSASTNDSTTVFDINSNTGRLDYDNSQNEYIIRPAFQIDLSKISWTLVEGGGSNRDIVYTDCLTFTGETSDFTLKATNKEWNGTLQYSTDHNNWTTLTGTEAMQSANKKLYLRGSGNTKFYTNNGVKLELSEKAGCGGNIQTLLDYNNPPTSVGATSCYKFMFRDCSNLTTAPSLPATTLKDNCYSYMFQNCTNLTTAPDLPATALTALCYGYMFQNCVNLTAAPALSATTLAPNCYKNMFDGCSKIISAPALPATTLASSCYEKMFYRCINLKSAPRLPASKLANYCYSYMFYGCDNLINVPDLLFTTLAAHCCEYMFDSCTSLNTAPALSATTLADYCYQGMFQNCTKLTTAPTLRATTLANACYSRMFYNCSSLTTAPALPASVLKERCYESMFQNCTSLTTAPNLQGNTLADSCCSYMFYYCTNLTTAPRLWATELEVSCYNSMFRYCRKLKIGTSSGNRIFTCPSSTVYNAVFNMFANTGGSFVGTPTGGATYYWTR